MDKLELTKITGTPGENTTTQIHEFDLSDGKLVILISVVQNESNIARMETIRGIVNFLHHEISSEFNFELFKKEIEKNISKPPFDILILYTKANIVYVFSLGDVAAYLFRDNKEFPLIQGKNTVHSVSGKMHGGDVFIIGTNAFFETININSILEYYNKRQLQNIETDFEVSIEQSISHGLIGGSILCQSSKKLEALDEEVDIPQTAYVDDTSVEDDEVEDVQEEPLVFEKKRRRFFVRSSSLYEGHGKNKKMTAIGGALLIVLSLGIFFGLKAKKAKDEALMVTNVINDAKESLSQARAISLVNKSRARELIYNAQQSVLGISTVSDKYPEVKGMSDEIKENLGEVGGIYEITPDTFSDLTLITNKMSADDMALSDEMIAVLGRSDNRVTTISLTSKRTETVNGSGSFNTPSKIALYSGRVFVWEGNVINEYGGDKSSVQTPVNGDNGLVSAFAGNLYLVDKSANQIWRYPGNDNGFGAQSAWLSSGSVVDLSKSTSMAIDGSIWVLSETGKITRFTLGNAQGVSLTGLDNPLSGKSKIFTSDEQKYLYILDPEQKSVYVFEKAGDFVAKYENEAIGQATNLVVSETNKIMVLAAGSKLLSIPLKHLQ